MQTQTVNDNSAEQIAILESQKDELLAKMDKATAAIEQSDPKYLEAIVRNNNVRYDGYTAKTALNWLNSGKAPGPVKQRFDDLSRLVYLHTATIMLGDSADAEYLRDSMVNGSGFYRLIDRQKLADELRRRFPSLANADLGAPSKLWDAFSGNMPAIEKQLAAEIDSAPSRYNWPGEIVKALVPSWEADVRRLVYSDYQTIHQSAESKDIRRQLNNVAKEIDALKQAATRPS